MFSKEQRELLGAPLEGSRVKRVKGRGGTFDHIETWDAKRRCNEVFGYDGWDQEIVELKPVFVGEVLKDGKHDSYVVHVAHYTARLRVRVRTPGGVIVIREDVGYGNGEAKFPGLAHELAVKEAVSDALKRTLTGFGPGFGLELYDKEGGYRGDDFDDPREASPSEIPNNSPPPPKEERQISNGRDDREEIEEERPASFRDRVAQRGAERAAAQHRKKAFDLPDVPERATRSERRELWMDWGAQISRAIRVAGSRDEALAIVDANRDGLDALTEAARNFGSDLVGYDWAMDCVNMRPDAEDVEPGPARQKKDDAPSSLVIEFPENPTKAEADAYEDYFENRIRECSDRAEAERLIAANAQQLAKFSDFEGADMTGWALARVTEFHAPKDPPKRGRKAAAR